MQIEETVNEVDEQKALEIWSVMYEKYKKGFIVSHIDDQKQGPLQHWQSNFSQNSQLQMD